MWCFLICLQGPFAQLGAGPSGRIETGRRARHSSEILGEQQDSRATVCISAWSLSHQAPVPRVEAPLPQGPQMSSRMDSSCALPGRTLRKLNPRKADMWGDGPCGGRKSPREAGHWMAPLQASRLPPSPPWLPLQGPNPGAWHAMPFPSPSFASSSAPAYTHPDRSASVPQLTTPLPLPCPLPKARAWRKGMGIFLQTGLGSNPTRITARAPHGCSFSSPAQQGCCED